MPVKHLLPDLFPPWQLRPGSGNLSFIKIEETRLPRIAVLQHLFFSTVYRKNINVQNCTVKRPRLLPLCPKFHTGRAMNSRDVWHSSCCASHSKAHYAHRFSECGHRLESLPGTTLSRALLPGCFDHELWPSHRREGEDACVPPGRPRFGQLICRRPQLASWPASKTLPVPFSIVSACIAMNGFIRLELAMAALPAAASPRRLRDQRWAADWGSSIVLVLFRLLLSLRTLNNLLW